MKTLLRNIPIVAGIFTLALPALGQIERTITAGTTPPAVQPANAVGSWALSDLESVNLFSGSVAFNIPYLTLGGRGGVQFPLTLPLERRWDLMATEPSPGAPSILYPNNLGRKGSGTFAMPYLERRNEAEREWCGGATVYPTNTLVRLHWIDSDGSDVELVDTAWEA